MKSGVRGRWHAAELSNTHMNPEAAFAVLAEHYEVRCQTHGLAFSELFALAVQLTGWPLPIAFAFTARFFPFEFELFCCRSLAESVRPRPHADRHGLRFDDPDAAQWN